jgi:hypothetical protein
MPNDDEPETWKAESMPIFNLDWARFGQWAIILGVLVWVLQSHDAAMIRVDELNRQERAELLDFIERIAIERVNEG